MIASFPLDLFDLFLLSAFRTRRLGMLVGDLRMLLGLSGVFLALGMVVLAVRLGSRPMRLRRGLVMFRRLIVCVLHFDFLVLAERFRQAARTASIVAEWRTIVVLIERTDVYRPRQQYKVSTHTCVFVLTPHIQR
jgi:hypothetical protein